MRPAKNETLRQSILTERSACVQALWLKFVVFHRQWWKSETLQSRTKTVNNQTILIIH
jgi:hypothetical protein